MKANASTSESPIAGVTDPGYSRSRRLRFSLRTVLLLFVLAAVAGSTWFNLRQSARMRHLEEENTQLRSELGKLKIEPGEEHMVHVVAVPVVESNTWKWRLYVPEGKNLRLDVRTGEIPRHGIATRGSSGVSTLEPGEQTLVVAIRLDNRKHYYWSVSHKSASHALPADERWLKAGREGYSAEPFQLGLRYARKFDAASDIELLRFRAHTPAREQVPELASGILVRIVPPK